MKITVLISVVPDIYYPVENHITPAGVQVADDYMDINPLDRQTLCAALSLSDEVKALHVGDTPREKSMRYLMAMGVKDVCRIDAPARDAYTTAVHAASYLKKEDCDVVMCSMSSWDYASGQVPEYLSQMTGIPLMRDVSRVELVDGGKLSVLCSHGDCTEFFPSVELPVILSCDKSVFPAEKIRIPSMRDMMTAMRKPVRVIPAEDTSMPMAVYTGYEPAAPRPAVRMLSMDDIPLLSRIIRDEGFTNRERKQDVVSLYSGRVEALLSQNGSPTPVSYPHGGDKHPLPPHKDIKDASVIISGGMGCNARTWELIDSIARRTDAATGCTRPVFHAGVRPYYQHVGQTGAKVSPRVYVAVGISGALQHVGGMIRSDVVVAINTDPHAPIFSYSDYGVVGDGEKVLETLDDYLTKETGSLS